MATVLRPGLLSLDPLMPLQGEVQFVQERRTTSHSEDFNTLYCGCSLLQRNALARHVENRRKKGLLKQKLPHTLRPPGALGAHSGTCKTLTFSTLEERRGKKQRPVFIIPPFLGNTHRNRNEHNKFILNDLSGSSSPAVWRATGTFALSFKKRRGWIKKIIPY